MNTQYKKVISTVLVDADEIRFSPIPGSVSYKDGFIERDFKGQADGSVAQSDNVESAVGMIKFDITGDALNLKNARIISRRNPVNNIKIHNDAGSFTRVMQFGATTNADEIVVGPDGKITLEIKGTALE